MSNSDSVRKKVRRIWGSNSQDNSESFFTFLFFSFSGQGVRCFQSKIWIKRMHLSEIEITTILSRYSFGSAFDRNNTLLRDVMSESRRKLCF